MSSRCARRHASAAARFDGSSHQPDGPSLTLRVLDAPRHLSHAAARRHADFSVGGTSASSHDTCRMHHLAGRRLRAFFCEPADHASSFNAISSRCARRVSLWVAGSGNEARARTLISGVRIGISCATEHVYIYGSKLGDVPRDITVYKCFAWPEMRCRAAGTSGERRLRCRLM